VSYDDPESWHANSPCSAHTKSRWMLGAPHAPRAPREKLRIAHTTNASVPTGGYSRPLAGVITHQQSRIAVSGVSGFFSNSARQPTGVPHLALQLSLINIPHAVFLVLLVSDSEPIGTSVTHSTS
jgi:hypothetical protein